MCGALIVHEPTSEPIEMVEFSPFGRMLQIGG
jgi:hypothetical protein